MRCVLFMQSSQHTEVEKRKPEHHEPSPLLVEVLVLPLHQRLQDRARDLAVAAPHKDEAKRERRQRRDLHRRVALHERQQQRGEVLPLRADVCEPEPDDRPRL